MINTAVVTGSTPLWLARAWLIPQSLPKNLCKTRVIKRPTDTTIGLLPYWRIQFKIVVFNGCKAELNELIPMNKIPKPWRFHCLYFGIFASMLLLNHSNGQSVPRQVKGTICPVICSDVWPLKTTPTACANVISPAFTKPNNHYQVVADELWMIVVTNIQQ